jgi:hypothetical protein
MTKRMTGSDDPPDIPNVFEKFGQDLKGLKGGIGKLLKYGEVSSEGEFFINPQLERWLDAIDDADGGDKSKLVAMMKSGDPLPDVIIPHIGDLIDRWDWVRPKHRMRIPSHQLTDSDLKLNMANCEVNDLLASGKSLSDAIKEVAALHEEHRIKETVLREYHDKRRSSARRAKARSYKRAGK